MNKKELSQILKQRENETVEFKINFNSDLIERIGPDKGGHWLISE